MVVAGLHNGNVAVYNLQSDPVRPVYRSSASNGKHKDIVWKVCHLRAVWPNINANKTNDRSNGVLTTWTTISTSILCLETGG